MAILLERIEAEPRQVDVRWVVLTALASLLYGIGWVVAKDVRLLLAVLTGALYGLGRAAGWSWAALRLGWQDARTTRPSR